MRLFFALFIIICGCSQRADIKKPQKEISPEEVRFQQARRTSQFDELVGRGVIEFRWSDEKGSHKEQGELDFWKQGSMISLRISKLGELLMWFGGNEKQYWLFDMLGEETTLTINGDGAIFSDIKSGLVLLGLLPLPEGELEISKGVVTLVDKTNKKWTVMFDPINHRPLDMTVIDGENISKALHHKGIGVEIENVSELNWPASGGLIDLSDSRGSTEIKIAFSSLSAVVSEERFDRVMSIEFLQNALKPDSVQRGKSND